MAKAYLSAKKQRTEGMFVKLPPGLTEDEQGDEPKFILKTVFTRSEESSTSTESPPVKMIKEVERESEKEQEKGSSSSGTKNTKMINEGQEKEHETRKHPKLPFQVKN